MPLPATRLALSHVGTAGNQGPHLAACADPKVRGLLRRRNVPALSQTAAAPKDLRTTHAPRARQRPLSSGTTLGLVFAPPCLRSAAAVSAALQPATCPDRASLETGPAPGDAQPLLRNASRSAESCHKVLRSLAPTEHCVAPLMLHYLRRYV
jgi:hypothetical protein